jgi:hypothetical protein
MLLPGSRAIDAIPPDNCDLNPALTTDQRGVARPQGQECDIGAVEARPARLGDLNCDRSIGVADAIVLLQRVVGLLEDFQKCGEI